MVRYKPNEQDHHILAEITNTIRASLPEWYGAGARLDSPNPTIRSYQFCFMLYYSISITHDQEKKILVKIRRNPKMDSLHQTIQADFHQSMILEYQTLEYLYDRLGHALDDFGAIRPLLFMQKYFAIIMEEFPSQTMRQLMEAQKSASSCWETSGLKDAARKTGRWLHYFHKHVNTPLEKPYTADNILDEVREYAHKIEAFSRGRVSAGPILETFAHKLETVQIDRMTFAQSHLDMTTNNVLYSDEGRVCLIDLKNRLAPVYVDLGQILTYPETSKSQIFSGGRYYPEALLRNYRAEIVAGYFEEEPSNINMVRIYSAMSVVDKWSMYEELMGKYKGIKHTLSVPVAPLVSAYFKNLLKKHLDLIERDQPESEYEGERTVQDTSV